MELDLLDTIKADFTIDKPSTPALSYLFAGSYAGHQKIEGLYFEGEPPSSQYFRRLIAKNLQQEQWDWRIAMNPEFMLKLISEAKQQD